MLCYTLLCPFLTSKLCILATDLIEPRISSLWKQILVTVNIPHAVLWFSSTKNRVEKGGSLDERFGSLYFENKVLW